MKRLESKGLRPFNLFW